MATWVIGDVQGCARPFEALLARLALDPRRDRVWLAGDLVNRGPDSLSVLRRAMRLGGGEEEGGRGGAVCVLGNHDLHLLAVARGARPYQASDTFRDVLDAPDRDELLDWLRRRPLVHHDPELGWTMVHAGLPPQWDVAAARTRAAEVERVLAGPEAGADAFFARMYGDRPAEDGGEDGSASASGDGGGNEDGGGGGGDGDGDGNGGGSERWDRLRYTVNALTRLRYVTADGGRIDLSYSGPPKGRPAGLVPWFAAPERRARGERIVFGHWASLELAPEVAERETVRHVDTGCVWGERLTALDLQSGETRSVDCRCYKRSSTTNA